MCGGFLSFLSFVGLSLFVHEKKLKIRRYIVKKENQEMTSLKRRYYHFSLVEITWRQIGVSRKTRPRSKLFMSLNFRMLLCWPFAHFQSSSTEMDWIDHIPPIVPVSFAMATGDTLTNAATLPFKTKVMQWLLQFFQRQQTQDISLFNQWTNISKYLVSPLCCLLGHCYRPGSRSCLWKGI